MTSVWVLLWASRASMRSRSVAADVVIRWQRGVPLCPDVPVAAGAPTAVAGDTAQPRAVGVTSQRSRVWLRGASWPCTSTVYALPALKEQLVSPSVRIGWFAVGWL